MTKVVPVGTTLYQTVFNSPPVQHEGIAGSSKPLEQLLLPLVFTPNGRVRALHGKSFGEVAPDAAILKSKLTELGGSHESTII